VNGTIAPGTSIGTLTAGDVTFNTGSMLEAEVNDKDEGDLLLINGDVTIESGAQVVPLPEPGNYAVPGVTVPILRVEGGTPMGRFDSVMSDLPFIDTDLVQFGDMGGDPGCLSTEVCLQIERNGNTFEQFAQTPNQTEVAVVLDDAEDDATGDLSVVYQNLITLTEDEVPPALDAIGGEQLTEFPTTRLAIAARFHRSIHERVRGFAWRKSEALFSVDATAGSRGLTASLQLPALPAPRVSPSALRSAFAFGGLGAGVSLAPDTWETGPGAWFDAYGIFGALDGGANASDVDYTIAGTSLGVDGRLADHWVVGGAAGYARTIDLDFERRGGSGDANTFQGALYAGRSTPRTYLSASGRFAWSDMNTSRTIVFADIDRRAAADFNGWDAGASIEGGVNLVEWWGVSVQPLASFDYVHVETEGYTEKGAGSLDLKVKSESLDSMVSGVGLRLHGTIAIDRITWITPEVRVRWAHEFGDRDRQIKGALPAAATGGAWLVRGASSPADGLVVGASWTVTSYGNLHIFADYDAVLNQDLVEHSLAVGIRLEW
jgi:outer membrane autotransporter protein